MCARACVRRDMAFWDGILSILFLQVYRSRRELSHRRLLGGWDGFHSPYHSCPPKQQWPIRSRVCSGRSAPTRQETPPRFEKLKIRATLVFAFHRPLRRLHTHNGRPCSKIGVARLSVADFPARRRSTVCLSLLCAPYRLVLPSAGERRADWRRHSASLRSCTTCSERSSAAHRSLCVHEMHAAGRRISCGRAGPELLSLRLGRPLESDDALSGPGRRMPNFTRDGSSTRQARPRPGTRMLPVGVTPQSAMCSSSSARCLGSLRRTQCSHRDGRTWRYAPAVDGVRPSTGHVRHPLARRCRARGTGTSVPRRVRCLASRAPRRPKSQSRCRFRAAGCATARRRSVPRHRRPAGPQPSYLVLHPAEHDAAVPLPLAPSALDGHNNDKSFDSTAIPLPKSSTS